MHLTLKTMSIKVEMQITREQEKKNQIFTAEQSTVRPIPLQHSSITIHWSFKCAIWRKIQNPLSNVQEDELAYKEE